VILSDRDLRRRLAEDLTIEPLADPDLQIQPASVDLRLGREFLEFRRTNIPYIHPDDEREVEEYVEETVVDDDGEFVLHPGDFVLGTTVERVEIPPDLIAHVQGRSSLGRLAVVIHASLPYEEQVFLWTPTDGFGFHEIGEVVENERPARAVAFDPETLRVRTFPITDYIENPTKRIYRVELDSGRSVAVTRDHNLFTLDSAGGVRRVPSEDAAGHWVMVPRNLPDPPAPASAVDLVALFEDSEEVVAYATDGLGSVDWDAIPRGSRRHYRERGSAPLSAVGRTDVPEDVSVAFKQSDTTLPRRLPVSEEFAWVLGFYVAEGYARRKQVVFTNTDGEYLDRVAAYFREFDASLSRSGGGDDVERLTVCSALWSKLFRTLAGAGGEKTVPDHAWDWPTPAVEAFLDGLLDGDGHRREERDTLYTGNEDLADAATYLGTRLGLSTATYSRERETYVEPSDCEYTGTEHAVDFYDGAHRRGQFVPVPGDLLRSMREGAGLTMAEAAEAMGYSSASSVSNVESEEYDTIKRSSLERFRDAYREHGVDTTRIDQLLDGGVEFDRVASVVRTDRVEPTYDLEVQPNGRSVENFLGGYGGVFLSNTAGVVDPGYQGQITLELSNLGAAPVSLTPGMRISQLILTQLSSPAERPYGAERGSKYQDQSGPQASRIGDDEEYGGRQGEDDEAGGGQ
jgi:dCTP deaminase